MSRIHEINDFNDFNGFNAFNERSDRPSFAVRSLTFLMMWNIMATISIILISVA